MLIPALGIAGGLGLLLLGIAAVVWAVRDTSDDSEPADPVAATDRVNPILPNQPPAQAGEPNNPAGPAGAAGLPPANAPLPVPNAGELVPGNPNPVPGEPLLPPANPPGGVPRVPEQPGVAPGNPARPPVAIAARELRYQWQKGRSYDFAFSMKADSPESREQINGTCRYSVNAPGADGIPGGVPGAPGPAEPARGSGTGFIVHQQGYLVTCEHVVRGAESIVVHYGDQKLAATVVHKDRAQDIALIRIEANNLPTVSIGDSDQVQLAEEVRAIGFPLSDILGNNVKITTGSVSGINRDGDRQVFQVDAAINPGNSGGPIVDSQGRVIGVASAKLSGRAISKVGFAVPSNAVKQMLKEQQVPFSEAAAGQPLTGPQLAARVTPAIVLIEVTLGPDAMEQIRLNYDASFARSSIPIGQVGGRALPQRTQARGIMTVDLYGEILDGESDESLPFLMGSLNSIAFENLSDEGRNRWGYERELTINRVIREERDPFDPFGGRAFGPRFGGGPPIPQIPRFGGRFGGRGANPLDRGRQDQVEEIPAIETVSYTLVGDDGDVLRIRKQYSLTSREAAATPSLRMTGEGQTWFSTRSGVPERIEFKGQLLKHVNNVTVTIPISFECSLQNPGAAANQVPGAVPGAIP